MYTCSACGWQGTSPITNSEILTNGTHYWLECPICSSRDIKDMSGIGTGSWSYTVTASEPEAEPYRLFYDQSIRAADGGYIVTIRDYDAIGKPRVYESVHEDLKTALQELVENVAHEEDRSVLQDQDEEDA
jgi:hypothetical protein